MTIKTRSAAPAPARGLGSHNMLREGLPVGRAVSDNRRMPPSTHDLQTPADIVLHAVKSDLERHAATTAHEIASLTELPIEQVRVELDALTAEGTLSARLFNHATVSERDWSARSPSRKPAPEYGLTLYTLVTR